MNVDLFDLPIKPKKASTKRLIKSLPKLFSNPVFEVRPQYIGQNIYIRPSYIVSLPEYHGTSKYTSLEFKANQANLLDNTQKGNLSFKAVGKMKNAINWMLCSADDKKVFNKKYDSWFTFKVNFITLTLPDTSEIIDNKKLQSLLLNPLLTYLRSYHKLKNYVWKLEFQKNGKLHVHFVSDVFIHHQTIRKAWNALLKKNKYLVDFYNKFQHENPNSTDIHSIKKVKDLAAYLTKYMTKNSKDLEGIKGRIWGCNQELSKANKTTIHLHRDEVGKEMMSLVNSKLRYKKIEIENSVTKIKKSIGEIFFLKYKDWIDVIKGQVKDKFDETILFLKNIHATQDQLLSV